MSKIPLWFKPSYWTASDVDKEILKAKQALTGEELDRRLIELKYMDQDERTRERLIKIDSLALDLKYKHITNREYDEAMIEVYHPKRSKEFREELLKVKVNHGEISEYEFQLESLKLEHKNHNHVDFVIAKAEIDLAHEQINQLEFDKTVATAKQEPWVTVVDAGIEYNPDGSQMSFELDWNNFFVEELRKNGWSGLNDADVVDQWFTHVCMDMMDPFGDYVEEETPSGMTRKTTGDDNKSEYS